MNDSFGKQITVGMVVEISNAFFATQNGMFVVENVYSNGDCYLCKLTSRMTKTKQTLGLPLRSYLNDAHKNRLAREHNEVHAKIQVLCPYVEPEKKPVSNEVKILKKGIRKGENYCPCFYWKNNDGSITIYSRQYNTHIPREIGLVRNDSDSMTDYFETDSCRVTPDNPYYKVILKKVFGE